MRQNSNFNENLTKNTKKGKKFENNKTRKSRNTKKQN